MSEKPRYTATQLGLLVLAGGIGIGAMVMGFFVLFLVVPITTAPTLLLQILATTEAVFGLVLWIMAMHLLHQDLRRRWHK